MKNRFSGFKKALLVFAAVSLIFGSIFAIWLSKSGILTMASKYDKLVQKAKDNKIAYNSQSFNELYITPEIRANNAQVKSTLEFFYKDKTFRNNLNEFRLAKKLNPKQEKDFQEWDKELDSWLVVLRKRPILEERSDSFDYVSARDLNFSQSALQAIQNFVAAKEFRKAERMLLLSLEHSRTLEIYQSRQVQTTISRRSVSRLLNFATATKSASPKFLTDLTEFNDVFDYYQKDIKFDFVLETELVDDLIRFRYEPSWSEMQSMGFKEPYWRTSLLKIEKLRTAVKATMLESYLDGIIASRKSKTDDTIFQKTLDGVRPIFKSDLPVMFPLMDDLGPFVGLHKNMIIAQGDIQLAIKKLRTMTTKPANMTP